jgi:hypothetical protein
MVALVEGPHTGEFILSEANGSLSRETVTVVVPAGSSLPAGAVLASGPTGYAPIDETLAPATAVGILYGPLTNAGEEAAAMTGVVIDAIAEVRGVDLDWNGQAEAVQLVAITLLRGQGIKVRDYTPLGS